MSEKCYVPADVFYEIYKHQLCDTIIDAMGLFAMMYVLQIHISVFQPHQREIVKMSQDKFKIFDLSRISAFIKHIVFWSFRVHTPLVNLNM